MDGLLGDWGPGELLGRDSAGEIGRTPLDLTAAYLRRDPVRGVLCLGLPLGWSVGPSRLYLWMIHDGPGGPEDDFTPPEGFVRPGAGLGICANYENSIMVDTIPADLVRMAATLAE